MLGALSAGVLGFAAIAADYGSRPAVISWDPAYPRTGQIRGSIEVKGIAMTNNGWKVKDAKVKVGIWPAGGGVAWDFEVEVKNGVWGPATVTGLSSADAYNVLVVVPLVNGKERSALVTGARVATAR